MTNLQKYQRSNEEEEALWHIKFGNMWQKTEGQRWWQLFAYHYCLCGNDGYIYIHIYVLVFVAIFHFSGKQEQVNLHRTTADCHRLHGF